MKAHLLSGPSSVSGCGDPFPYCIFAPDAVGIIGYWLNLEPRRGLGVHLAVLLKHPESSKASEPLLWAALCQAMVITGLACVSRTSAWLQLGGADSCLDPGLKDPGKSRLRMGFLPFHSLGNVTKPHS